MSVLGKDIVDIEESENSRKLFIGGLNRTTTDDSLKAFFEKWGDVVDVVVKMDTITNRSRGFGFITYSKSSMLDVAMANRPHEIDGCEVDTKPAVPRNDRMLYKSNIVWAEKKIFITGIREQTEEDFIDHFEQYGSIFDINIIRDKETGKNQGFGFIEFDSSDSVDRAVYFKYHTVSGSQLIVRKAFSRDKASASRGHRGGPGAISGIRRNWRGSNYNYRGGYHFGGYGGGWVQGWNINWGSRGAIQRGWVYQGNNFSQGGYLYTDGPMQGHFGNIGAVTYHSGYGRGNFHQNSRGGY